LNQYQEELSSNYGLNFRGDTLGSENQPKKNPAKKDLNYIWSDPDDRLPSAKQRKNTADRSQSPNRRGKNPGSSALEQENDLLQSEIHNLLRRKKNFQDSFDLKLDKQEELIHRLDSENIYQMSTFEALLMLIKQEDITKTIYDERSSSLEENFQFMQTYLISLDSFIISIKDTLPQNKQNVAFPQNRPPPGLPPKTSSVGKNYSSIDYSGPNPPQRASIKKYQPLVDFVAKHNESIMTNRDKYKNS
jgi:hypothetical protein